MRPGLIGGALLLALALPGAAASARRSSKHFDYCAHADAVFRKSQPFVGMSDPQVEFGAQRYQSCSLGWMAAEGIGYFRAEFDWPTVEPLPGQFDLSVYDPFVIDAARHHIRVLGLLMAAPNWASTKPSADIKDGDYPPRNPGQFGTFAALMVERYGPGGTFWRQHPNLPYYPVLAWQIWNEQNLAPTWEPAPNMRAYVSLLKASYKAIKHVDSHAIVVSGGMPFYGNSNETHVISELYRWGGRRYFDALAIHTYSATIQQGEERLLLARRLMDRFGDGRKPLWATEVAWAGGDPDGFIANPRKQRQSVIAWFKFVGRNRPRLRLQKVIWFEWRDDVFGPGPRSFWEYNEGLLNFSGRPKPALAAFSAAARRLDR